MVYSNFEKVEIHVGPSSDRVKHVKHNVQVPEGIMGISETSFHSSLRCSSNNNAAAMSFG